MGPYVACENKVWVQKKQIDFGDYVDAAYDEGMHINLTEFRKPQFQAERPYK